MKKIIIPILFFILSATAGKAQTIIPAQYQEMVKKLVANLPKEAKAPSGNQETKSETLIDFAKSMLGIRYRYATSNPKIGFDCSGFVSYVFSNFGFKVPRSSREFSGAGKETNLENAKVGDVLIFTGSNSKVRRIGHVGIVYSIDENGIKFIHASSGKAHSVTITELNGHYRNRFMKIVSIL
ncbi:C40 family peptidase [Pedobacter sp. MC2016-05]|uniref:C40 family peptidase n=1 Tax=Pedobacter sp. MC2016-05 TaxID=2994474 RepID=UPI001226D1BC|nr:C40 family peptidase [Pedobacter sp. MC2016-05]MCX2475660.1 C40 family peptidase [Pedobacter sp. MC2016-05]RZK67798.1 MAG: NlpC/P60 family protein [Pedobacter sp.]